MTAGSRPHIITIQRKTVILDELGGETATWAELGREYASVRHGSAQERREAAQEQASQTATFGVLSNAMTRSISVTDRIVWDGSEWDIVGAAPSIQLNAGTEITAVRAVG